MDPLPSPRADSANRSIKEIAHDVVAAEVEGGLDLKKIGRGSPKLHGVSVYLQVSRHVNKEMANSDFIGIVEKARERVMARFGKQPDKLIVKEGSVTNAAGEHTSVDLKRIAKHLAPVFQFVCGSGQRIADCRLPPRVLSLLKAIDRELVAQLLSRRKEQLDAQKLWSAALPAEDQKEKLQEYGWSDSQFKKLVNEGVWNAAKMHTFRVNMFAGLLFTRCVSPFILYTIAELGQDSSKRIANPPKPLVKLSEGANKLFKKNHGEFVEDFVTDSTRYLPEHSAEALATISRSDERISSVKQSKKSPSGSSKSYARSPGRHSAPVLPQGAEFRKVMEQEKKAVDAEAPQSARPLEPVDYKARRDAAIDKFKSGHASDFADEDFAIAFNITLRKWRREAGEVNVREIAPAMLLLHERVKKELARRHQPELDGPPVQSPAAKMQGSAREKSSSSTTSTSSTTPQAEFKLDRIKAETLRKFVEKRERRNSFQRYPALLQKMEQSAVAWAQQDTGSNFVLALKKIFEEELQKCFYQTYRILGGPGQLKRRDQSMRVNAWKEQAENVGKPVHLEELCEIMSGFMPALTLPDVRASEFTRRAEAATERFMQRPDVAVELQNNVLLKKVFLHDIRQWISNGGFANDQDFAVQQTYHDALLRQYQEKLRADGVDNSVSGKLRLAGMTWWQDNETKVLTTTLLDALLITIKEAH